MIEGNLRSGTEEESDPCMPVIMLIRDTEAFVTTGKGSKQDCLLDISLTYREWLSIFFDALGLDKTGFEQVKAERKSSSDGVPVVLGEFDDEIPDFPLLSRIRGPYHDAVFEVNEIDDLREECLRVQANTQNTLALQGMEKLLIISAQAGQLGLSICFVSN
jgi:hypothetical protein